jgi:hypothetical protein
LTQVPPPHEPPHEPPGPGRQFWIVVEQQVAAALILAGVAAIAFIAWEVPLSLDQLLTRQRSISDRLGKAEIQIDQIEHRLTILEAK